MNQIKIRINIPDKTIANKNLLGLAIFHHSIETQRERLFIRFIDKKWKIFILSLACKSRIVSTKADQGYKLQKNMTIFVMYALGCHSRCKLLWCCLWDIFFFYCFHFQMSSQLWKCLICSSLRKKFIHTCKSVQIFILEISKRIWKWRKNVQQNVDFWLSQIYYRSQSIFKSQSIIIIHGIHNKSPSEKNDKSWRRHESFLFFRFCRKKKWFFCSLLSTLQENIFFKLILFCRCFSLSLTILWLLVLWLRNVEVRKITHFDTVILWKLNETSFHYEKNMN